MNDYELPAEAEAWLGSVKRALVNADPAQRAEIIDGLRAHIMDALERGDAIAVVLAKLGSPADIATQTGNDQAVPVSTVPVSTVPVSPETIDTHYLNPRRIAQIVAFGLAITAAAVVAFLPGYTSQTFDAEGQLLSSETSILLFSMGLTLGVPLVLSILISAIPLALRGKAWRLASKMSAVALVVVVASVAVVSVAFWFLVPSVLAEVTAALLPTRARRTSTPPRTRAALAK